MSAEVFGKPDASSIVTEAGLGAGNILLATGYSESVAWTTGQIAARYGAELLLAALSELKIDISLDERGEEVREAIEVIADCTAHPQNIDFYRQAQEAGLKKGDFHG